MKRVMTASLCLLLLLAACAGQDDKPASSVADYLPDALSQPMSVLYDKALTGDADDWLKFGLALTAGRPSPVIVSDADKARLMAIDVRLQAAKREWLKENPPDSLDMVPWDYQINLSQEDATLIWQADQKLSADYWLSRAKAATYVKGWVPGTSGGKYGPASLSYPIIAPQVDPDVLLMAAACTVAVRKRAGLTAIVVPEVVRRLRDRQVGDIEVGLTARRTPSDIAGSSPCGSPETFNRYVALLKAASP